MAHTIPGELVVVLAQIEEHDTDYAVRYVLVLQALALAAAAGLPAGIGIDLAEPGWPVVAYLELPEVGQVSWHLPAHPRPWDGHSTEEKYRRIRGFVALWAASPAPGREPEGS